MGGVADCAELAVALVEWGRKRYTSGTWKKKLEAVSADLLREDVDLRTAHATVELAHEAGYAGPELLTVEERIGAIERYERKRTKPPRTTATKMRKKRAAPKPATKPKATKPRKPPKKRAKKPSAKRTRTRR